MQIFRYTTKQRIDLLEREVHELMVMGYTLATLQEKSIIRSLGNVPIEQSREEDILGRALEGEVLLLGDNLLITPEFLDAFLVEVRKQPPNRFYCAAVSTLNPLVQELIQPLCSCVINGDLLCLNLFYICTKQPQVLKDFSNAKPLAVELLNEAVDALALPPLMPKPSTEERITFRRFNIFPAVDFAPLRIHTGTRLALPIEHWVHYISANIIFGIYSDALRFRDGLDLLFYNWSNGQREPNNIRELISIGEDCQIDPSATVIGPTIIGNHVTIEPGATVVASVIGDNCFIGQGNQVRLSVFEENVILPPATNMILWSVLGHGSLINSQINYSVVGEECFIGALTCVTDRILDNAVQPAKDITFGGRPVKVKYRDRVVPSGYWILGAAFGNRSMTASGTVVYPGRELPPDSLVHLKMGSDGSFLTVIR